jgi:hypothetical protein
MGGGDCNNGWTRTSSDVRFLNNDGRDGDDDDDVNVIIVVVIVVKLIPTTLATRPFFNNFILFVAGMVPSGL